MMNLHKIIYIKHSAINQHLKPFSRLRHILGTANIYFTTPKKKRRIQRNLAAFSIKNLYEHLNHFLNPFFNFFLFLYILHHSIKRSFNTWTLKLFYLN